MEGEDNKELVNTVFKGTLTKSETGQVYVKSVRE